MHLLQLSKKPQDFLPFFQDFISIFQTWKIAGQISRLFQEFKTL